jgi:sugar/nucleoside kinase (ribokinase family)
MVSESVPIAIVGNLNLDICMRPVDRFPGRDEEHLVDSARVELAGTAGYALRAWAALGLDAFIISTVGNDAFGQMILQSAQQLGISLDGVAVIADRETPLSLVFVASDGSRSIMSTLGAHAEMSMDIVIGNDAEIARCQELFICGSYLLPQLGPADIRDYAQAAQARGQAVVFDPSWDPSGWGDRVQRETLDLLQVVDIYMPNDQELCQLTRHAEWRDAAQAIADLTRELVIKRGAHGAAYVAGGEWVETAGFEVEAVNTIGAGDVFDMAYLFARRVGWPPRRRLEFACALAALVVAQAGTRRYPSSDAVLAFLQERLGRKHWGMTGPVT